MKIDILYHNIYKDYDMLSNELLTDYDEITKTNILEWYTIRIPYNIIPCAIIPDLCDICFYEPPQYITDISMSQTLTKVISPDYFVKLCNICHKSYTRLNVYNIIFKEIKKILGNDISILVVQYLLIKR